MGFDSFDIMFTIVTILTIAGVIFTFTLMFSARARARMMGVQVKAVQRVVEENKEALKEVADDSADISKDAITTMTRAVVDGIVGAEIEHAEYMFCKHCGAKIDADSKFCKECGKEL